MYRYTNQFVHHELILFKQNHSSKSQNELIHGCWESAFCIWRRCKTWWSCSLKRSSAHSYIFTNLLLSLKSTSRSILHTPETVYRVAICRRGNLPYIRNYPICNTVFNHIYPVGSWIYLPHKWFYPVNNIWCISYVTTQFSYFPGWRVGVVFRGVAEGSEELGYHETEDAHVVGLYVLVGNPNAGLLEQFLWQVANEVMQMQIYM